MQAMVPSAWHSSTRTVVRVAWAKRKVEWSSPFTKRLVPDVVICKINHPVSPTGGGAEYSSESSRVGAAARC